MTEKEMSDEELNEKVMQEAVKYQELAKFIAHDIFHTDNLEKGYMLIAKFASEGYFIVKENEIKEND